MREGYGIPMQDDKPTDNYRVIGHGKRLTQLRSLDENAPSQKCQCTERAWCSRVNDAGELKALADARDGMVIELTLIDGIWHGVHTDHADGQMMLEYRMELEKTWPNHEVRFDVERNLRVLPRRRRDTN